MKNHNVIHLPNNQTEVLFRPEDFADLVQRHLGYDAGQYLQRLIADLEEEADYNSQKINTDINSYEDELYQWSLYRQEIQELMDELQELVAAKRLNRKRIEAVTRQFQQITDYHNNL